MLEIERKFLIQFPDLSWLEEQPDCKRFEIRQTYLAAPQGQELRLRLRKGPEGTVWFKTLKMPHSGIARVELEEEISEEEYLALLGQADPAFLPIVKTRYCLNYLGQCLEIDLYPFWNDKAILEIELADEDTPIRFPGEITIVKEVTDDPSYKNAALALMPPSSTDSGREQ